MEYYLQLISEAYSGRRPRAGDPLPHFGAFRCEGGRESVRDTLLRTAISQAVVEPKSYPLLWPSRTAENSAHPLSITKPSLTFRHDTSDDSACTTAPPHPCPHWIFSQALCPPPPLVLQKGQPSALERNSFLRLSTSHACRCTLLLPFHKSCFSSHPYLCLPVGFLHMAGQEPGLNWGKGQEGRVSL